MDVKIAAGYSAPVIPVLIASIVTDPTAILSSGDTASYLLLGAAIGGMLSLIFFKPTNWWDAFTRWGAAVGMSVLLTPLLITKIFGPGSANVDTVTATSGIVASASWMGVLLIRSITVKDMRGWLLDILRLKSSDKDDEDN